MSLGIEAVPTTQPRLLMADAWLSRPPKRAHILGALTRREEERSPTVMALIAVMARSVGPSDDLSRAVDRRWRRLVSAQIREALQVAPVNSKKWSPAVLGFIEVTCELTQIIDGTQRGGTYRCGMRQHDLLQAPIRRPDCRRAVRAVVRHQSSRDPTVCIDVRRPKPGIDIDELVIHGFPCRRLRA